MRKTRSSVSLSRVGKAELIEELTELSPLTTVAVNNRRLQLDIARELIEGLPEHARFRRHGLHVFVEPDPFAAQGDPEHNVSSAMLVSELIARQEETDRRAAAERSLWRRMVRFVIGSG